MYKTAEEDEVKNTLKILKRMLTGLYGKPVILLIDEYDVPLAKASEKDTAKNQYYSKMLDVIQSIMSAALKDHLSNHKIFVAPHLRFPHTHQPISFLQHCFLLF